MRFYIRVAVTVVFALSLRIVPAFAQRGSASLTGKVADPGGLSVVGVNVQAVNVDTNVTYPTMTNEDGIYNLPTLPPGTYRISVEKYGFERIERPDVVLHVADNISIDFVLQIGAVAQTVTVEGGAPLVDTTNAELGGLVQSNQIESLPLNGRNYINLTLMQTGITTSQVMSTVGSFSGTFFSSNGATTRSNNFMLDGAIMQDATSGTTATLSGRTLGIDGIQEYRVITNSFSSEYGLVSGSQTIMVSKGGTNVFHGSVFEYLRNSVLDAANYFDRGVAANNFERLPPYKRNNFGASFGGPIKKDKTFFFATFEGVRERLGITVVNNVPAANCHGPAGATISNVACPQMGSTQSATIPAVVAPFLALYPLPNLTSNASCTVCQFTTPFTQPDSDNFGQIRVDHLFSENDSIFVRYTVDEDFQTDGLSFPEYFVNPRSTWHSYATLGETHVFSSALLNNFRFSFSHTRNLRASPTPPALIGPQFAMVPGEPNFGQLAVGGLASIAPNKPASITQEIGSLSDDLGYTVGRHSLKFGTAINRVLQGYYSTPPEGSLNFASLATFLAGKPSTFTASSPLAFVRTFLTWTMGFYVQDDWRLRSNFTVNAGLRYEPAPEDFHEVHGFNSALIHPLTDASFTLGPDFTNPTWHNFSPRLGFAWDVWRNGKTAVRGGASILYDLANLASEFQGILATQGPFATSNTVSNASSFTLPLTFPAGSGSTMTSTNQYNDKQMRLYTENLTVEQQLPSSMVLSVSYAGSRGEHLAGLNEGNPNIPMGFTNGVPFWNPNPSVAINRYNPAWGTIQVLDFSRDSSYNALEVGLNKRITKGLQFQASYTWSKLFDNGQGGTGECLFSNTWPSDPFNSRYDRGLACFSLPQYFTFNFVYSLPSPKIQERFLAALTSGWGTSGIFTAHSGYPFNPLLTTERSRSGVAGGSTGNSAGIAGLGGLDRPNYNPAFNGPIITGNPNQWFNPAAFSLPPVGTLGNVGRDSLLGPSFNELDLAVLKNTKLGFLGEAGNLEFRAEAFNIFNHPNFSNPNTGVYAGTLTDATEAPLSTAGSITSTIQPSRQIEFSLRVVF